MLHKRMVFGLVVVGMMCFLGRGAFGEEMEIELVKTLEGYSK